MTNKQIKGSQCTLPCASLVTFSQLFANSRSFQVPNYQRPYSWNESQRTDLLQDIDRHERLTLKKIRRLIISVARLFVHRIGRQKMDLLLLTVNNG